MILAILWRLLGVISRVVPRSHRAAWREEWAGELEQIARTRDRRTALRTAAGALADAMALRRVTTARSSEGHGVKGLMTTGITWLDVKLAVRMLVRYPGLTAVSVIGMAVGIAIAAGAFGILYRFTDPSLPLDEGDRIVVIQNWDTAGNRQERRILHDYVAWRDELTSFDDLGAYREVSRNVIGAGAQPETVRVAEMSASGFVLTRVQPLMGRYLTTDDERHSAAAALVIGEDVWRQRFASDPGILGRTVQLGDLTHTIVGVMPEGYRFPQSHSYWTSLRLDAAAYQRRGGPGLTVFARLAPEITLAGAQAELDAAGARAATAYPATHAQLRPRVLPYTYPAFDIDGPETLWMVHLVQSLITLLLLIVAVNVAILVYARTATRHAEIAVRTALGASRQRIVGQLFVEALVLAAVAAAVGLGLAHAGLAKVQQAMAVMYPNLPFWWEFGLSTGAVIYVVALAVGTAGIVGVIPALKATGARVLLRLQSLSAGGGSGMRLGRTWTILIVAQVAFAVALLPPALYHAWNSIRSGTAAPGFAAEHFLTTLLVLDRPAPASADQTSEREYQARYTDRRDELARRLAARPEVEGVTFSSSVPGEEPTVWVEAEGASSPGERKARHGSGDTVDAGSAAGHEVRLNLVATNFFSVLGIPMLAGRAFNAADANPSAISVIVNRSFADALFGDAPAVGRRLRYVGRSADADPDKVHFERWFEIVGVVPDFPLAPQTQMVNTKIYHAAEAGGIYPVNLAVRLRQTPPLAFAGPLRELSAQLDPNLQLRDVADMSERMGRDRAVMGIVAVVLAGLTAAVLLLSAAGIYAMMSFTIAQRRKEIGIRAALGADARQILGSIFTRVFAQLGIGAALGIVVAILLDRASEGELLEGHTLAVLPIVAVLMVLVGLLAALGPARRGLRIQPTEALREQ